jgi:guanine nucleotide exchange factor VAV
MSDNQDWLLCAKWLVDCQILTRDSKAVQPESTIQEFSHALRDGVLICLLLNRLRPKTLDPKDFSQRPQMSQFLCIKNIKVFLEACRKVFGLSDDDLFNAADLFEGKDIKKVIATLSLLSQTPVALSSHIASFVLTSPDSSSPSNYYNLDTVNNGESDNDSDEEYYTIVHNNEEEEDVYGEFVDIKRSSRLNDSHNHNHIQQQPTSTLPKSKLEMCTNELLDTEKNYVKCLEMITQQFMRPLKAVVGMKDFGKIFRHVEKLCEIHQHFLSELTKACSRETTLTIADCFIMSKEKFLIYGEFCSNLIEAQELLDRLCTQDPKIQQYVMELQMKANEGRFKLRDLLSVPMQRVLKYHLLLKELIKHTDTEDKECKSLQRALDETQDLSLFVNEVKRDNETLNALSLLQKSIADLPLPNGMHLKDYGRLLMDGEVKVKTGNSGTGQRHVFILDRLIIICKAARGDYEYTYINSLTLTKFDLDENVVKETFVNTWWFTMTERSTRETFAFGAKKEELANKWISAIKMAKDNIRPQFAHTKLHEFAMESFLEPTICDVCKKLLRGVFFQGYRCTKTKMNVHKECLEKAKDMTGRPVIPPKLPNPRPNNLSSASFNRVLSGHGLLTSRTLKGKVHAISNYAGIPPPIGNRPPLLFEKGDAIDLYNDDGDFWEGHLSGREGFFPKSFIQKRPPRRLVSYEEVNENGVISSTPYQPVNSVPENRSDDLAQFQW